MIEYLIKFEGEIVEVALITQKPNERNSLVFSGTDQAVSRCQEWLSEQTGAFGHLIGSTTSATDLDAALKNQNDYKWKLNEGHDIVTQYDSGLRESPDIQT